jgi:hypothetical protein
MCSVGYVVEGCLLNTICCTTDIVCTKSKQRIPTIQSEKFSDKYKDDF